VGKLRKLETCHRPTSIAFHPPPTIMAGRVRHPIDIRALEAWISKKIPEIEVPLGVKQVTNT
jgi:hypothetical protein